MWGVSKLQACFWVHYLSIYIQICDTDREVVIQASGRFSYTRVIIATITWCLPAPTNSLTVLFG